MQIADGSAEDSLSDDDDDDQEGALSSFLPADIPSMPHDIGLKKASMVQVAQVHHDTCITQESAVIAGRHAASSQQTCCAPWFHAVLLSSVACLHVVCLTQATILGSPV